MMIPYLHFDGQCAAALTFYADLMDGSDLRMMRYGEAPEAPAQWRGSDLIMHGQVTLGEGVLMGSDYPPGTRAPSSAGFSVMFSPASIAEAQRIFNRLADDGEVLDPMKETFFSPAFGMVRDRFNTPWIISARPETD